MTPCDIGCHVMCCHPCACDCHDEPAAATIDAVVAASMRQLDDDLAQLVTR